MHYPVIIIGSGPAGLTAAIYAARADLSPLCIEGLESGGQLMQTTEIENFPGFRDGLMGPELMMEMRAQAERFGTKFVSDDVNKVELLGKIKKVTVQDQTYTADAVIISTGAKARMLGLENEKKLIGRGVSTCATCDGFFFRDQEIVLVGGGDSAMEEAMFLTKFAARVHLVHRSDQFRASKIMLERARQNEKITFITYAKVVDILGEEMVEGVVLEDTKDQSQRTLPCTGLFIAIGHTPNTGLFEGQLAMDDQGYLLTAADSTKTKRDGVFACGDVKDHVFRQAITAAGSGCMAAMEAEKYLA